MWNEVAERLWAQVEKSERRTFEDNAQVNEFRAAQGLSPIPLTDTPTALQWFLALVEADALCDENRKGMARFLLDPWPGIQKPLTTEGLAEQLESAFDWIDDPEEAMEVVLEQADEYGWSK